jgi:diacylglycerol kinase
MKNQPKKNNFLATRISSFKYALQGLIYVLKTQTNAQIHVFATFCVAIIGYFSHISITEWCVLVGMIGLVISMETMNTALEALVDLVSPEHNRLAGIAKDVAAAAVLVAAMAAVVVGLLIFVPKWL